MNEKTPQILKQLNLDLVEAGFFQGKNTVTRAVDREGNRFILKTGGIEAKQAELFRRAKELEDMLSFRVPSIASSADDWILFEEIDGTSVNNLYDIERDWIVKTSHTLCQDYQKLVNDVSGDQPSDRALQEGISWLFDRLHLWSEPAITAGLIGENEVQALKNRFEDIIAVRKNSFFGWCHGNIIGDHLIVRNNEIYLLDLAMVPRPGGNSYYDFLRSLDFMILKARDAERVTGEIPRWIRKFFEGENEEVIKSVLALRLIGILGWDILNKNIQYYQGDLDEKKREILALLKECLN